MKKIKHTFKSGEFYLYLAGFLGCIFTLKNVIGR